MAGIDPDKTFQPLKIVVLTISDSRNEFNDVSGSTLCERVIAAGHEVVIKKIVPDEQSEIEDYLGFYTKWDGCDVVLMTGGTGVTARDVTPEAVHNVSEKIIAGFGELFRALSFKTIATSTIQSRATAGVASGTYMFAIPGSPGACKDAWDHILVHQLDSRYRPCNFAELIPRLIQDRPA